MKTINYENRLNLRLYVNIGCMIVSAVLFVIILGNKNYAYLHSMYSGSLGGLFFASLSMYLRNKKLKKNPERMNQMELLETDERNVFINRVSYTIFSYVSIGILYISMLVSGFFSTTVFYTMQALLFVDLILILLIHKLVEKMY